jgi:cytochrome c peroxidase
MFSDFEQHVIGVPQIAPANGNVVFDGPGSNEDFGLEQITGNPVDRYAFRTSPLRNVALQPTFFHNGAFTGLEDAVRHHLNVYVSAGNYTPAAAGLDADLRGPMGPLAPVMARVDPLLSSPIILSESEFRWLVAFVRDGLHDKRATPQRLRRMLPDRVPSRRSLPVFQ